MSDTDMKLILKELKDIKGSIFQEVRSILNNFKKEISEMITGHTEKLESDITEMDKRYNLKVEANTLEIVELKKTVNKQKDDVTNLKIDVVKVQNAKQISEDVDNTLKKIRLHSIVFFGVAIIAIIIILFIRSKTG